MIRKYYLHYLFIAVISFFLSWGYYSHVNRPLNVEKVGHELQERLHHRFEEARALTGDTSFIGKIISGTISPEKTRALSGQAAVYGVFQRDSLIWWSNYQVNIPGLSRFVQPSEPLMRLENGYYKIYSHSHFINDTAWYAVALVPVKFHYDIENQYLQSKLAAFDLPRDIDFSVTPPEGQEHTVIQGLSGERLFYISRDGSSQEASFPPASLWLFLAGLLFFMLFMHGLGKLLGQNFGFEWGWLLFVATVFVLRYVSLFMVYPTFLQGSELFTPHFYASSDWAPSLGDLFINVVLIFWSCWYFFRYVRFKNVQGPLVRRLLSALFVAIIFMASYLILEFTETLVIDSNLSFDINNFLSVHIYSWIGVLSLSLLFGSYYFIGFRILSVVDRWMSGWQMKVTSLLGGIAIWLGALVWHALAVDLLISGLVALLFLLIAFIDLKSFRGINRFYKVVMWIGFATLITSFYLERFNAIKEEENKILYANLLLQEDYLTEFLFWQIKEDMVRDPFVRNYFRGDYITRKQLEDQLNFVYLKGHLSKYDIELSTFQSGQNEDLPGRLKEYFALVDSSGRVTDVEDLYFFPNAPDQLEYLAIVRVYENPDEPVQEELLGRLVIEFQTKSIGYSTIYPELLLKEVTTAPTLYEQYDYAIYVNNKLVKRTGNFSYPVELADTGSGRVEKISLHGYEHLIYRDQPGKAVWISMPEEGLLEPLSLFSIILLLNIFVFLLIKGGIILFNDQKEFTALLTMKHATFATRIQSIVIGIILISFLVIGAVVIINIVHEYEDYHNERLLRKSRQILSNLSYLKAETADTAIGWDQLLASPQLKANLSNLSEVHNMDFNIYGRDGRLVESSQPGVFERGIIAKYMHPLAKFELFDRKISQFVQQEEIGRLDYLASYIPVMDRDNEIVAVLNLPYYAKEKNLREEISNFLIYFINIYVLLLALAAALGLVISNSITRPISQLGERMRRVQLGARNTPIKWKKKDEIGRLIAEYNLMLEQLEESARLLAQTERESAWREMARQVAHEIKNPLTPMRLSIQHLQRSAREMDSTESQRIQRVCNTLLEQIDQLSYIASEFSNFAKMPRAENEPLHLTEVVESVVKLYEHEEMDINFSGPDDDVRVFADGKQLGRVFQNLVKNAIESIPEGKKGQVNVNVAVRNMDGKPFAHVTIQDNGIGMDAEHRRRIFEPNFTTKTTGTGLGLPISKKIIELAGGTIEVTSESGKGSTFVVVLPIYEA